MQFKRAFVIGALFTLAQAATAQAPVVAISPVPKLQFLDNNGKPLAGGCVATYAAGTTTPIATYTDFTGTVTNPNPVVLDSSGRASIWIASPSIKYVVKQKSAGGNCSLTFGTTLYTTDGVRDTGLQLGVDLSSGAVGQGAALVTYIQPPPANPITIAQALGAQGIYDLAYPTLAQACQVAAGASAPLLVTKPWNLEPTETLTCAKDFLPGGLIQPANGATVTLAGALTAPDVKVFDTSIAGAGSIVFSGQVHAAHVEWFGASPAASGSQNVLAIQSALWAWPAAPNIYNGNSSGSMTNVPERPGVATIGCGSFTVSNTIYLTSAEEFRAECGGGGNDALPNNLSSLNLANNSFSTGEQFMIEVLPRLSGLNGTPSPNLTFNVRITGGLSINANGYNNLGASCIKIYGAEGSKFDLGVINGCAVRGVIIGDTAANDATVYSNESDSIKMSVGLISGLFGPTQFSQGPGLFVHCQTCDVTGPVQHFNGGAASPYTGAAVQGGTGTVSTNGATVNLISGTMFPVSGQWAGQIMTIAGVQYVISSAGSTPTQLTLNSSAGTQASAAYSVTAEVNPEIWIADSFNTTIRSSYGECENRFVEVTGASVNIMLDNVAPAGGAAYTGCSSSETTGIRVGGSVRGFGATGMCSGYTNTIYDLSAANQPVTIPCQMGFYSPFGPYNNNLQQFPNGVQIGSMTLTYLYNAFLQMKGTGTSNTSVVIPCNTGQTSASLDLYDQNGLTLLQTFCDDSPMQVNGVSPGSYSFANVYPALHQVGTEISITDINTTTPGAVVSSGGGPHGGLCVWSGSNWLLVVSYY